MQEPTAKKVHIVIMVAGTNEPSNSNMLAERFADGLRSTGVEVAILRLKDYKIDHFDLRCYDKACSTSDQFPEVQKILLEADGLVIASPIWNFSVPAHLKNVIDRIGAFALDDSHSIGTLGGKPIYLILTGGSPAAAWPLFKRTTSHLSVALQYFGGSVMGTHFEGRCTPGRGVFGLVVDKRPESLKAVAEKGKAFAVTVQRFKATGELPWTFRLRRMLIRWAQKLKRKLGL